MEIDSYEELKPLVKAEAEKLKIHATHDELSRLNIETLFPSSSNLCIYGQMTGQCYSVRAEKLIHLCVDECIPDKLMFYRDAMVTNTKLDGSKIEENNYLTPIEKFIMFDRTENNAILIDYLKGKNNELIFE